MISLLLETIARKRSALGHRVHFKLSKEYVLQGYRLFKHSLIPLEYRRDMKDLVLIYNARAGHGDLGHQDLFVKL